MRDKRQDMVKCVVHSMVSVLAQGMEDITPEEKKVHALLAQTVGKIYEDILSRPDINESESSMKYLSQSLGILVRELIRIRYARTHKACLS